MIFHFLRKNILPQKIEEKKELLEVDYPIKKLKKMDKPVVALIIGYIEKNLVNYENPRALGKALIGNHKDKWRYRVGDYRLLTHIEDEKVVCYTHIYINLRKQKELSKG